MVFCGKPSRGCDSCRKRRIKCDQVVNACGQCIRKSIQCPGYRDQLELMFRDQSEETTKRVRKKQEMMFSHHDSTGPDPDLGNNLDVSGQAWCMGLGRVVDVQSDTSKEHAGDARSSALPHAKSTILSINSLRALNPRLKHIEAYSYPERHSLIQCLDYYLKFCGPKYVWRQEVITHGTLMQFTQTFVQTSFAEPAFLEIILAICQADLDSRCQAQGHRSMAALEHRSKALCLLRAKLVASASATDEGLLATVVAMVVFDMTMLDWKSYEVHLKYLRQVMRSADITGSLGWQGWFAYTYAWAELRWANHIAPTARENHTNTEHAVEPQLSRQSNYIEMEPWNSRLPVGFCEVARTGCLDPRVVGLLVDLANWTKQCAEININTENLGALNIHGIKLGTEFAGVLGTAHLTAGASLICIGAIAYITSHVEGPSGHSRGLEDLTSGIEVFALDSLSGECGIWVAMTLAAANDTFPTALPNRWTLLDSVVASSTSWHSWNSVYEIVRKFFWDDRHVDRWKRCLEMAVQRRFSAT